MEGAALRFEREYDLAIAQVWHGARFSALAQAGKLKALSNYIGKRASGKRSATAEAIAFFHAMKAKGLPVKIERKEPEHGRRL